MSTARSVTANFRLTGPPVGGSVVLDYANCAGEPVWVAIQNDTAAWQAATGSRGRFTVNASGTRIGIALAYLKLNGRIEVHYMSRSEFATYAAALPCPPKPAVHNVSLQVVGLQPNQQVILGLGGNPTGPNVDGEATFSAPRGTYDLIAYSHFNLFDGVGDRVAIRRGINTATLAPLAPIGPPLNPNTEGAPAAVATISLANASSVIGVGAAEMVYYLGPTCEYSYFPPNPANNGSFPVRGVPQSLQHPSDRHGLQIGVTDPGSRARNVFETFGALVSHTVTLPSVFPAITLRDDPGPYRRLGASFTMPADLGGLAALFYRRNDFESREVFITGTPAYFGGRNADLSMPDLSGLAGWNPDWSITQGTEVEWIAQAFDNTGFTQERPIPYQCPVFPVTKSAYATGYRRGG
jgi:hypothetical protein